MFSISFGNSEDIIDRNTTKQKFNKTDPKI